MNGIEWMFEGENHLYISINGGSSMFDYRMGFFNPEDWCGLVGTMTRYDKWHSLPWFQAQPESKKEDAGRKPLEIYQKDRGIAGVGIDVPTFGDLFHITFTHLVDIISPIVGWCETLGHLPTPELLACEKMMRPSKRSSTTRNPLV